MAKRQLPKASTDVTEYIFVPDSSSSVGAGLTGLVFNSAGLACYYVRPLAMAAALTLATQTVTGAHSDGGFVEVDATNMPGFYRLDLSDAICATGVDSVVVMIEGATNMAPVSLEIQLTNFDLNSDNPDVNVVQISNDSTAADNLELQYDTTGLTGDTFPSTQAQLNSIALTGAAINSAAESYVLTTGTQSSGAVSDTVALDGTNHEHTDTAGAMDLYYQFDIGGDGSPTSITVTGYLNGNNDNLEVYAYNWGGASWDQVGTLTGKAASTNDINVYTLFTSHVGTGANLGKVRFRLTDGAFTLTTATLAVDQIYVSYAVISRTVGYANGAIWVDTNASNTNTESFVDGVADNPVSTWAAALTISGNLNITRFSIINGSSITLSGNSDNYTMLGASWTLALGGQSIVGIYVEGANVSGIAAGTGTLQTFSRCLMGATTHIKGTHILESGVENTQTVGEAGDYFIALASHSGVAGSGTWSFDFGAAIGNTNLNLRSYSGGVQFESMGDTGTDTASVEGFGQVIEGTCTGGTVVIRGFFTLSGITNLTISDDARYDVNQTVIRYKKNTASSLAFKMVDATDGITAEPGLTPTATRSIDGAAFGAAANAVVEIGSGWYDIVVAASDHNGDVIIWNFADAAARDTEIVIITQ